MTTMTATATMTADERLATEAFHADLLAEFVEAAECFKVARCCGAAEIAARAKDAVRSLYREIKEVEFCLATNVLPF